MDQPGDGPVVARLRLGVLLRRAREAAGYTGEGAAEAIGGSESKISRMEAGKVPSAESDVADLLALYRVTDSAVLRSARALARESRQPPYWRSWSALMPPEVRHVLEVEAAARSLVTYDPIAVPVMLQTADYATAVAASSPFRPVRPWRGGLSPSMIARRQELLRSGLPRKHLWAVIDEAVLHRRSAGDTRVQREQIARLLAAADRGQRDVTVQIVPADSPHTLAAPGPFTIVVLPPDMPDAVILEHLTTLELVTDQQSVDRYKELRDRIAMNALGPPASEELLRRVVGALRRGS